MAVQLGALRDALMSPGNPDLASKAAEEVAAYENQFTSIKLEMAGIKGELVLVRWSLAVIAGGVTSLVLKAFF